MEGLKLPENARVIVAIEGLPVGARIVPHKTDATKLMLKSPNPEGGSYLLQLIGIEPGPVSEGSEFFMVEVDKKEFLERLPILVEFVTAVTKPTKDREPVEEVPLEVVEGGD
jgi:hypothetical protein